MLTFLYYLLFPILLVVGFVFGPRAKRPELTKNKKIPVPPLPDDITKIAAEIQAKEAKVEHLKPDNEARIIFYTPDSPAKTEWSMVYLHGFSSCYYEAEPVHRKLAKKFGMNLYLPRLHGHGLDDAEPLLTATGDALLTDAAAAIAVGRKLGSKVLALSTSTGGTLALWLTANNVGADALVLLSPNIQIRPFGSSMLAKPWGLYLARLVVRSKYLTARPEGELHQQYWTTRYRLEAITHLQALLDATMTDKTFAKVKVPVFMGYYYKNIKEQDTIVSVAAMQKMFEQLGTPEKDKMSVVFPEAGHHCIGCGLISKQVPELEQALEQFLTQKVGLNK